MKDEAKLETAKSAVLRYLEDLDPTDYVAVVTFDKKAKIIVPLQQAVNKKEIAAKVMGLKPGTYTALYEGIRMAYGVVEQVVISQESSFIDKLLGKKPSYSQT
jgi:Mg-chelatase subunit ChlD